MPGFLFWKWAMKANVLKPRRREEMAGAGEIAAGYGRLWLRVLIAILSLWLAVPLLIVRSILKLTDDPLKIVILCSALIVGAAIMATNHYEVVINSTGTYWRLYRWTGTRQICSVVRGKDLCGDELRAELEAVRPQAEADRSAREARISEMNAQFEADLKAHPKK